MVKQGQGMVRRGREKRGLLAEIGEEMALRLQELSIEGGSVGEIFSVLHDGMGATMYVRAADGSERGYGYVSVPDHHARLASVNIMAKLLRIAPEAQGASVTVNAAGMALEDDAINVTASERLDELERAGGSREPILAAVRGLLETLEKGQAGQAKGGPAAPAPRAKG